MIFILLLIVPFAFKGRIAEIAKREINKNLNARVEFTGVRLSLIRNFPNMAVSLTDMSVVGLDVFENDTLVSFKAFRAVVDLKSVISGSAIQVRTIILDTPRVKTVVLADGSANWNIMKDEEDIAEKEYSDEKDDSEPGEFLVQLQRFEVRNGRFEYDDIPFEVRTTLEGLDLVMRGDLTQDLTSLEIKASSERFNFWFEGMRYINNASLKVNTQMDADLNNFRFTFRDNDMLLNELIIGVEGFFAMPESDIDMDLAFFSKANDFKSVLSLVPAIYLTGFEELSAKGTLRLEGFARGSWTDDTMPSVGMDLVIEDAGFSYPDLPKSLDNFHMDLSLYYDGVDEDKTTVDLRRLYMEMAGNPFEMSLSVRTPVSDMHVSALSKGMVDFTSLADVIPLEDFVIRGLLETDLSMSGQISDLENERYESFNAEGRMRLTAFQYEGPGYSSRVSVPQALLEFTPRFVELSDFESQIGRSDLRMSGRLENFIPYMFNDGTITGNLMFSSGMLDLNELIGQLPPSDEPADTVPLSIVEIPENIDFTLASSIDNIIIGNMEINNLKGRIIVRDSRLVMENVNMNLLGGSLNMNGEYNTRDITVPFINFAMDIVNFDIPSSFHTFNTVQRLTPIAGDLTGSYSSSVKMYALLDDGLMPLIRTIDAHGRLRTTGVEIISSETFNKLSGALGLREDRSNVLRNMNIDFTIAEGRVYVEPFETGLGPVDMSIVGDQGIDGTMNYVIGMVIPRSLFGSGADQVINSMVSAASSRGLNIQPGENVNVDAMITGTFTDPQISLSLRESARANLDQLMEQVRSQAMEEIESRLDQAGERVREEASERAAKLLQEAGESADQIRRTADEAAEAIRKEGESAATRVEQEASGRGRIAEAAAKRTADGIRREAAQKADVLVKEANERADKILEDATREAEKLN